ncbi:unnamed protein product [Rhizoctonia solani]|uniref:AC transposase n=1 Tax=Rhizoctonia solani TaxID=456999 RepID=A0A8H3C3U4_9AGAM|nr:unnamed protein product [Rhizoctonia solani]
MVLYEGMTAAEIKKLSDAEVWSWPDDIIIAASRAKWRAPIYGHYTLSLRRDIDKLGGRTIWFVLTCKTNPVRHKPQSRRRGDDSSGTKKFNDTANKCNIQCNRIEGAEETVSGVREFSLARFRALLALWCARNHRPFEMISDDLLVAIVNELRPGTALPDPTTLSRDIQSLYQRNMQAIRHYFQGIDYIHLAMDGWTAPTSRSYLGVVIIWETAGKLRRAILEFIQLTKRHTGEYLAQKTEECLNKYGLGPKLLTVCMDNASNNNTFTTELQKLFPSFGGPKFRSRCGAHITNLMAKAYLSIFSKPSTRKRGPPTTDVVPAPPAKRRRGNGNSVEAANAQSLEESPIDGDIEIDSVEGPVDDIDEDKAEYDTFTVKASVTAAFSEAEKSLGIKISESDRQMAQQLLPKISGLANRAKNSPVVQHKFEQYAASIPGLSRSPHPSLPCSVATRWNTELTCIRGHVQKRAAVKQLTADRDLSLREYQLTDPQWELSAQLVSELRLFERLTLLFSETQVPLIHQVIPALMKLRDRLQSTVKSPTPGLHPLLQVAAFASLKVFDKYMRLFEDASIYWVAIAHHAATSHQLSPSAINTMADPNAPLSYTASSKGDIVFDSENRLISITLHDDKGTYTFTTDNSPTGKKYLHNGVLFYHNIREVADGTAYHYDFWTGRDFAFVNLYVEGTPVPSTILVSAYSEDKNPIPDKVNESGDGTWGFKAQVSAIERAKARAGPLSE